MPLLGLPSTSRTGQPSDPRRPPEADSGVLVPELPSGDEPEEDQQGPDHPLVPGGQPALVGQDEAQQEDEGPQAGIAQ